MNEYYQDDRRGPALIFILCALMFIVLSVIVIIFSIFKGSSVIKKPSVTSNISPVPLNSNSFNFGSAQKTQNGGASNTSAQVKKDLIKNQLSKTVNTDNWKSYSDNPLSLSLRYPAGYKIDSRSETPNHILIIGPPNLSADGQHFSINQPVIEFFSGPSAPNDTLEKFVADRKTLRSIDDKVILEKYTTLNNIPVYHEILQDPIGKYEESYLAIVNGQRILIINPVNNQPEFNSLVSTIIYNQLSPTLSSYGSDAKTRASNPITDPLFDDLNTQKLTTINDFVLVPTVTPKLEPLPECKYGPGEANCIATIPRTCISWKESGVLAAFLAPSNDSILRAWYQDEHALTLGVGIVSPITKSPDFVLNPNTGNPDGVDLAGRPSRPALFITDITNNPSDRSGDWEYGGISYNPTAIYGTWKALNANNPVSNGRNLGPGSTDPPASVLDKYVSEIQWDLSKYNLVHGRVYRLEFMVHDGDGGGGDAGEKCATINY
jgi:hypothetical protein